MADLPDRSTWVLVLLSAILGASPAMAATTSCDLPSGATMQLVRYFDTRTTDSPLCDRTGKSVSCSLSGWLYQPSGLGPFPAVVLNHSNVNPRSEGDYCAIVEFFIGEGYVVFEPVRRGFSGDAGLGTNTGELPDTTVERLTGGKPASKSPLAAWLGQVCGVRAPDADCVRTELDADQRREIMEAVAFLKRLNLFGVPTIHSDRIALIGHAAGANITAMAAVEGIRGVRAAVLLSPGERTWDSDHPYLMSRLFDSVSARQFSLAVMQPRNGESVEPTASLSEAAITTRDFEFMASLLPAVGGDTPEEIQRRFATRAQHVNRWAPLAWRFFHINGVK